ncbi:MAG: N-acetyl-gamma-glutamyl-phosphate reductase [Proteobacteria bacterium]|nr:N-acetyl-gamma-glutamyl-phosphate reductase [Pseudomonadota bacterium]
MIKAVIVGGTGYTGLELIRLLLGHPRVKLTAITSTTQAGKTVTDFFPSLNGKTDLSFEPFDCKRIADAAGLAFTALPHGASMDVVSQLVEAGLKVIDLSADFRLKNLADYNEWYGEHKSPELLEKAAYGLPELNGEEIKDASLVANPGCYPTSAILPLYPLLKDGVIDSKTVVINSASGLSGAGRVPASGNIFCEANENFKAYKVGEHRHTPEIESVLSAVAGDGFRVTFTPHLLPVNRGILSTITANLNKDISSGDVLSLLSEFYAQSPFVRICEQGTLPAISNVRGSNYCDIGASVDKRTGRLVVVSVIDNLIKGASGQAVQNMNVLYGFAEDEGLSQLPLNL